MNSKRDNAWIEVVPDDIYLEIMRLAVWRLIERCNDPAILQQIHDILLSSVDQKFAQAVRKAEARDALKKALHVIAGGKKVT